jgi:hypothetical protein
MFLVPDKIATNLSHDALADGSEAVEATAVR